MMLAVMLTSYRIASVAVFAIMHNTLLKKMMLAVIVSKLLVAGEFNGDVNRKYLSTANNDRTVGANGGAMDSGGAMLDDSNDFGFGSWVRDVPYDRNNCVVGLWTAVRLFG